MQSEYTIVIILGILLMLSPLVKGLMGRLGVPSLVGYILLGFLVTLLNEQWHFITVTFNETIEVLAQLGVVALLFRVGLKSHTDALLAKLPQASFIWIGDILANLVLGFVVSRYVLGFPLDTSLVITAAFSATSVAVSVVVWEEMHRLNTSNGQLLVDVAELDDLSGVLLLAVLLAIIPNIQSTGEIPLTSIETTTLTVLVKLALFITGCYLFSHYAERKFTRFNRRWENSTTGLTITVLGTSLVIAAIAGYLGFSLAIGALFAGLAFSRDPGIVHSEARFAYFYEFLTPFFFIAIGMQLNPDVIIPSLGLASVLLLPAVTGKLAGVTLPALKFTSSRTAFLLGLSMIPRAEIAMVIIHQCRQLDSHIVPDNVFSAVVLISVTTSILPPLLLRKYLATAR